MVSGYPWINCSLLVCFCDLRVEWGWLFCVVLMREPPAFVSSPPVFCSIFSGLVIGSSCLPAEDRLTAGAYLATWGTRIFPAYLSDAIHPFFHSLLPLDSDERVQVVSRSSSSLRNSILAIGRVQAGQSSREAQGHGKQQQQLAQDQAQQDGGQGNVGRAADNTTNPKDMEVPVGNGRLAPFDLLARVGALLTDTGDLESRLLSGDFGEDMVEMNSAEAEGDSQPHEGPGDGMDRESEGVMVVGEVAKDEFYEHQFRERDGEFRAALVDDIRLSGPGGGLPQKEDVQLPLEGGWEWAGEWVVQQYDVCDANGWMYRSGGTTTAEGPSSSSSMKGWSAACTADSLWRRRCWKRRRRRIAGVPSTSTGSAAQAGEESAGAATWRRPRRGPQEPVPEPEREQCEGMVLLTALLCTLLRGARYQDSKLTCLSLLCRTSALCDDDTRLQRAVPSLLAMVGDSCAMVRAGAVEALASILGLVENLPPRSVTLDGQVI